MSVDVVFQTNGKERSPTYENTPSRHSFNSLWPSHGLCVIPVHQLKHRPLYHIQTLRWTSTNIGPFTKSEFHTPNYYMAGHIHHNERGKVEVKRFRKRFCERDLHYGHHVQYIAKSCCFAFCVCVGGGGGGGVVLCSLYTTDSLTPKVKAICVLYNVVFWERSTGQ